MLESVNRDAGNGSAGGTRREPQETARPHAGLTIVAMALGAVATGIAVDLVLPAIPILPAALGSTTAETQLVLAFYVGGTTVGQVGSGWLADHVDRRTLFMASLAVFAAFSLCCAFSHNAETLIAFRFLQGVASSGPLVVIPGMVRARFADKVVVRVMGLIGSIQSLVPALAPIAGKWLASAFGWPSSFVATTALGALTFAFVAAWPNLLPAGGSGSRVTGSYRELFRNAAYMRQALGFALVLGGLVVFVFGAPVVMVNSMGGTTTDFIAMQVVGVGTFIAFANLAKPIASAIGTERTLAIGTGLALLSGVCLLGYAIVGGHSPAGLIPLWIPMNAGWGLRAPTGFVAAIDAAGTNDARASALIGLFITGTIAIGTAVVAPFLDRGLIAPAIAAVVIIAPAIFVEHPRAKHSGSPR
jgi:predicted MFS family arabinose efflux permease